MHANPQCERAQHESTSDRGSAAHKAAAIALVLALGTGCRASAPNAPEPIVSDAAQSHDAPAAPVAPPPADANMPTSAPSTADANAAPPAGAGGATTPPPSADASTQTTAPATTADGSSSASSALSTTHSSPAAATDALAVHGSIATRYRGRWTDGDHDHDLYAVGTLEIGDPLHDAWTGFVQAETALDLDGRSSAGGQSPFFSLQDTYEGSLTARLYSVYAEYHHAAWFDDVRIGRQFIYDTPAMAWFDGAYVHTRPITDEKLQLGAFAGLPVHEYESSSAGDFIGGTFAEMKPWHGARARFDWMHLEDQTMFGDHSNDLFKLDFGQSFGENLRIDANATRLDDANRDYTVKADWVLPEDGITIQATFYQLLEEQKSLALEIDPFYTTLLTQFPYYEGRLLASKDFGDKLSFQGGADFRRMEHQDDIGEFNRDFDHGYLTALLKNLFTSQLDLSLTGDLWYGGGSDITTWGADLSRKIGSHWTAGVGSYFSLFKYELFANAERDDVRTYYVNARWKNGSLSCDVRYEYEDAQHTGTFNTLRLGATWSF
jgi:hypothetical protein